MSAAPERDARAAARPSYTSVLRRLRQQANPAAVAGMARYGINPKNTLGVPMPRLRLLAREIGKDHRLALRLWASGIHEGRILASLVEAPERVTERQMERWVGDLNSWDVCDQCCSNLFRRTRLAYRKAASWSRRKEEFVRRAGFVLMAELALHDRTAGEAAFLRFLPLIKRGSSDPRNFVRKAVSWALRRIGRRSRALRRCAIQTAREIARLEAPSSRWVAADALRELDADTQAAA